MAHIREVMKNLLKPKVIDPTDDQVREAFDKLRLFQAGKASEGTFRKALRVVRRRQIADEMMTPERRRLLGPERFDVDRAFKELMPIVSTLARRR